MKKIYLLSLVIFLIAFSPLVAVGEFNITKELENETKLEKELEDRFMQELIIVRDEIFTSFMDFQDFTNYTILNEDWSVEDDTLSETIEIRVNKVLDLVTLRDNLLIRLDILGWENGDIVLDNDSLDITFEKNYSTVNIFEKMYIPSSSVTLTVTVYDKYTDSNLDIDITLEEAPDFEEKKTIKLPHIFERDLPIVGIAPDSSFYWFKKFFEGFDILFTFDDVTKAEKYLKYAELRLAEAKKMTEKGKLEFIDNLIEEYEANLEKGNEISKIAQQIGKNITKITELVAVATTIHLDVLEDILKKFPGQTKPSIEKAITSSKKENEEALNILEKAQPEKAAEIHFRIAEKILIKVQEKADEDRIEEIEDLIEEYEDRINKSSKIAEIAKALGDNTTTVEQLIAKATSTHLEILSEIHEKVSEQVKAAIEKAMDVSIKVRKIAVEALKEEDALEDILEEISIPEEIKDKIFKEEPEEIEVENPETQETPGQPKTSSPPTPIPQTNGPSGSGTTKPPN